MALDGVVLSHIVHELKTKALGGRVDKIYQPEKDEVILNLRCRGESYKLMLTASPSHPRLHFTSQTKANPMQAPLFCMVLRKHLTGGKIVDITQPGFERVAQLHIEALNDLGDVCVKTLIIEIMGKHSNIMLVDENGKVLEAVKHISHSLSAVREVLPGKAYTPPPGQGKINPLDFTPADLMEALEKPQSAQEAIYKHFTGISPFLASAVCHAAGLRPEDHASGLSGEDKGRLCDAFAHLIFRIQANDYHPTVLLEKGNPMGFTSVDMPMFTAFEQKRFETAWEMLDFYYGEKDALVRTSQKNADIRKLITQNLERCAKKRDVYIQTMKDIQNRDTWKMQGELITANMHTLQKGMTAFTTQNFYDENLPMVTIPLDAQLTPAENAQKYFKQYNKAKRTFAALKEQMAQNSEETTYLEGLLATLFLCTEEADIEDLREELMAQGFIKKRKKKSALKSKPSKPLHYISGDGFHMFVGKNNRQNDELTLKVAENSDWWFHTKDIPGAHVIVKAEGQTVPESTLNEAANLAAYYSKGKNGSHVPVDYTTKRFVKKPNGAKPGMVIYDKYQTAVITPDEALVQQLKQV